MRIRAHQINPIVGDISGNTEKIFQSLRQAQKDNIDLLVLPEMCLCGYPAMDLLERKAFIDATERAAGQIIRATGESVAPVRSGNPVVSAVTGADPDSSGEAGNAGSGDVANTGDSGKSGDSGTQAGDIGNARGNGTTGLIFGLATRNTTGKGRFLHNSAIFAFGGEKITTIHKSLLPTYDVFDECRHFEPGTNLQVINFKGCRLAITICEDIWFNFANYYLTYRREPLRPLVEDGAALVINISGTPFARSKPEVREKMLLHNVKKWNIPMVYSNQVGANTELIFDGDSMMIDKAGKILERCRLYDEDWVDANWDPVSLDLKPVKRKLPAPPDEQERIFGALVLGVRDYFEKSGLTKKALIGLSGGLDSALTAVIAVEALGKENVTGITMPSEYSSGGSIEDSRKLAENLGIEFHKFPVRQIYESCLKILEPVFRDTPFGLAEENLQSRARGMLLMAVSNKFGHILLNTGNKSELAVGYCTLYGDMAGGLSVISDLYKTEVNALSQWLNEKYYRREVIPEAILSKEPSAELRPDQKDSDSLPEYEILDGILREYIDKGKNRSEIAALGFDPGTVAEVIRMVDVNEYKRRQAPPGLRVSSKAFGPGRQMPVVQRWSDS